mmetsp:Transcript_123790/g.214610  ORF Transcript_123790/g.214610 Transcript_123790/m.214610 type:complete len:519 (+) Transcript_123790:71-1627(+)
MGHGGTGDAASVKSSSQFQKAFFEQQEQVPVEISPAEPNLKPLQDFGSIPQLHAVLKQNICEAGYESPTPVQKWGIPLLTSGKDVMACAQTGSGKTAFYLFPPINKLLSQRWRSHGQPAAPTVLIMGPTRELCVQIFEEAQKFTQGSQVNCAVVYGGTEYRESTRQIADGVDLLVATPGRLQDLCERRAMVLRAVHTLVLDEADRMLDMGFEPHIRKIVLKMGMNRKRQTVMTSATFPEEVQHLAQDFMSTYSFMAVGRVGGAGSTIRQKLEWVEDADKDNFLYGLLLHQKALGLTLIFVNTKQQAVDLQKFLTGSGFSVQSIHGDRTQSEREEALEAFKSSQATVLIATDVAARGLDIPNVALVVQYDLAMSVDDYVHRIGRTGRMGKRGISVGMMNNRNKGIAGDLIHVLEDAGNPAPAFLIGMAISSGTYKQGGAEEQQDARKLMKQGFQTAQERAQARIFAGFNKDAYGQGDEEKAKEVAATVGPAMPGSYYGAVPNSKGGKKGRKSGPYSGKK